MTIAAHLRVLNERLGRLERCVELAPAGTYIRAREARDAVAAASNGILAALSEHGFRTLNDDRLRNLEAAVYGYFWDANPDEYEVMAAEGFGEHVDGPAGAHVLARAVQDRDFLSGTGSLPATRSMPSRA